MALSLRQAARTAGVSKSTISRAIQAGRLSATRSDDGGWSIDPAELCRVYPLASSPVSTERPIDRPADGSEGQDATPAGTPGPARDSLFETQLDALRQLLEAERRRADELIGMHGENKHSVSSCPCPSRRNRAGGGLS